MISEQKVKEEIAATLDNMRTAPDGSRDYLIGSLATLLFVSGQFDRGTAFSQACQAWDKARPQGD